MCHSDPGCMNIGSVLGYSERRKLLQEAKLQPKIKLMVYEKDPRKSQVPQAIWEIRPCEL